MAALRNPAGNWKISPTAFANPGGEAAVVPGGWFGGWLGVVPYWQRRGGSMGVTDGSDALPGQLGEYVELTATPSFTTGATTQQVTVGVLTAGDWFVQATFAPSVAINACIFVLNPVPPGVSNAMPGAMAVSTGQENAWVVGMPARALTSVSTVFVFDLTVNAPTAGGYGDLLFQAWRMR